jgi:hypothetical protein
MAAASSLGDSMLCGSRGNVNRHFLSLSHGSSGSVNSDFRSLSSDDTDCFFPLCCNNSISFSSSVLDELSENAVFEESDKALVESDKEQDESSVF